MVMTYLTTLSQHLLEDTMGKPQKAQLEELTFKLGTSIMYV